MQSVLRAMVVLVLAGLAWAGPLASDAEAQVNCNVPNNSFVIYVDPRSGACGRGGLPPTAMEIQYAFSRDYGFEVAVNNIGSFFTSLSCGIGTGETLTQISATRLVIEDTSFPTPDRFSAAGSCELRGVDENNIPFVLRFSAFRFVDTVNGLNEVGFVNARVSGDGSLFDTTAPNIRIGAFTGAPNGPQTAVITLSEDATNFTVGDLSVTNATATLTGSGSSYTAVLTPTADGPVTLSVAAASFTDAAGNGNAASNAVTTTVDITAPVPVISGLATVVGLAGDEVTVDFGERIPDFSLSDLDFLNLDPVAGSLSGGTDGRYTFRVVATGDGTRANARSL